MVYDLPVFRHFFGILMIFRYVELDESRVGHDLLLDLFVVGYLVIHQWFMRGYEASLYIIDAHELNSM